MKPRALVRAYNLLLSFDTTKKDNEVEQEINELIEKINSILVKELPGPIPQLELEHPDKKLKIGIKIYSKKELEDEE